MPGRYGKVTNAIQMMQGNQGKSRPKMQGAKYEASKESKARQTIEFDLTKLLI